MVSFLIDAALAVMLVTATVYLVIVNQRLKLLRTGQSEINALISTFSRSIDDTDASMKRLVGSASDVAGRLSEDLDRAKALKEDMALILGSCERTMARMEESVQHARGLLRRLDEGAMQRAARRVPAPAPRRLAEAAAATAEIDGTADADETAPSMATGASRLPVFADDDEPPPADTAPHAVAILDREVQPAAAEDAGGPDRQRPIGAFYARLRTIGSEG
ncbi:DUF6468 domain-containing protein [Azospirillum sp. ST 5-10]|uniref:DUF6468 domain-containing protein n=1 Tax=unclassified Azospirillum TaxID=2630922 RepID=UPI003F4A0F0F